MFIKTGRRRRTARRNPIFRRYLSGLLLGWAAVLVAACGFLGPTPPGTPTPSGYVWHWGYGTLLSPAQVQPLSNVTAIAAGHSHNLALRADGTVWAWGDNSHG
jgi:hypothetical protein